MNKLTAEWCKWHIESMKANGMSLLEEKYMQALEVALPVLEQQEKLAEGWIEWHGGECPVDGRVKVEYRLRDGVTSNEPASCLAWEHDGECYDIIAYRVVEQERERGEEE